MLTLKLSSCPRLDDRFSLTYKHLDDLSRKEISQLLGEARVQAKKCSQSKYCYMLMDALGLSPGEVLTQSFPDRGAEWSADGVDSVRCNVGDSHHNCNQGFADQLDSQKHTQKKRSKQLGVRPRPPGTAHRRPPSAASIAGAGASHPSSLSFGKGGAQSRSKGKGKQEQGLKISLPKQKSQKTATAGSGSDGDQEHSRFSSTSELPPVGTANSSAWSS